MKKLVLSSCALAVLLTGCAGVSDTQRNTGIGAGVGALGGAAIGAATGNSRSAAIGAGVGAAAGALGGYLWSQRMEAQKRQMEQATAGTGIAVSQTANNELKLAIPSDAGFDTGRAAIKPALAPVLDQFATGLRNNAGAEVRIIGHTDSTGTDAINNPLSVERAASTRDYLIARGVRSSAIQIDGRGSREPVADNNTDGGRA
ncbi:MAG: OmpA family protein, partial [Comamonadaceae bacterium]